MMIYAQFCQLSTGCAPGTIPPRFDAAHRAPIEATGDRSVDNMAQIERRQHGADRGMTVTIGAARLGAKYVGTVSLDGAVIAMTVRFWPSWRAARDDAARLSV